jgi:hypothetical protein
MKTGMFLIFFLVFVIALPAGAAHTLAEGDVLAGIEEIGMIVSVVSPDMKFTEDEVKKYVNAKLTSNVPLLKVTSLSYPYLDVNVLCTGKIDKHRSCYLEIELRRIVYLPDKDTLIAATVWNKGRLIQGDITFSTVKAQLDMLLNSFARDYVNARKTFKLEVH